MFVVVASGIDCLLIGAATSLDQAATIDAFAATMVGTAVDLVKKVLNLCGNNLPNSKVFEESIIRNFIKCGGNKDDIHCPSPVPAPRSTSSPTTATTPEPRSNSSPTTATTPSPLTTTPASRNTSPVTATTASSGTAPPTSVNSLANPLSAPPSDRHGGKENTEPTAVNLAPKQIVDKSTAGVSGLTPRQIVHTKSTAGVSGLAPKQIVHTKSTAGVQKRKIHPSAPPPPSKKVVYAYPESGEDEEDDDSFIASDNEELEIKPWEPPSPGKGGLIHYALP